MNLPKEYILKKLLKTLKETHGFSFGKISRKKLYEQYSLNEENKKKYLISEEFNSGPLTREYSKLLLIQESIKLILECYYNEKDLSNYPEMFYTHHHPEHHMMPSHHMMPEQPAPTEPFLHATSQDMEKDKTLDRIERKIQELSDKINQLINQNPDQILKFESIKNKLHQIKENKRS